MVNFNIKKKRFRPSFHGNYSVNIQFAMQFLNSLIKSTFWNSFTKTGFYGRRITLMPNEILNNLWTVSQHTVKYL